MRIDRRRTGLEPDSRRPVRSADSLTDGSRRLHAGIKDFSRTRVQGAFQEAVVGATDAPNRPLAESLGRLLYLAHLGVILWWLLDRSPQQRATKALVALIRQMLPSATLILHVRSVRGFVRAADALFQEALLGQERGERPHLQRGVSG